MTQIDDRNKVLIIGAGPGGLVLAQVLRRHNIPFEIFERDLERNTRSQGWAVALVESVHLALQQPTVTDSSSFQMHTRPRQAPSGGYRRPPVRQRQLRNRRLRHHGNDRRQNGRAGRNNGRRPARTAWLRPPGEPRPPPRVPVEESARLDRQELFTLHRR